MSRSWADEKEEQFRFGESFYYAGIGPQLGEKSILGDSGSGGGGQGLQIPSLIQLA